MQIEAALEAYTLQLRADGRSVHTERQAERHIRLLTAWLAGTSRSCEVEKIRHEDVAGFIASPLVAFRKDGKPRKPTSANAMRSTLRAFFSFVHAAGYSPTNSARLVRRAMCGTPPPKALTEPDQEKLLAALATASTPAEKRDRALFTFLLGTGARIGSTLAAEIADLDLVAAELRLRREKGRRERTIYLPERVVALLREHVSDRTSGPIFEGQAGAALTARHVARRLRAWCERAGVRVISPHGCRHSFASRVHGLTGDLLITRAAMGHHSISSTVVYATIDAQRLRAVVTG